MTDNVSAPDITLSERERAALLALAEFNAPAMGYNVADLMRANGREKTSDAGAHQAANALDRKGLAVKLTAKGSPVRYQLTDAGRERAAAIRRGLTYDCCEHCPPGPVEDGHHEPCPHGCNHRAKP